MCVGDVQLSDGEHELSSEVDNRSTVKVTKAAVTQDQSKALRLFPNCCSSRVESYHAVKTELYIGHMQLADTCSEDLAQLLCQDFNI